MEKYFCDRCEKELPARYSHTSVTIEYNFVERWFGENPRTHQLCDNCSTGLKKVVASFLAQKGS